MTASKSKSLVGNIANGRRATATFPFYSGPVGIRERDESSDVFEVAFFAPSFRPALPTAAVVDGVTVTVTEVVQRGIVEVAARRPRATPMQSVIATVTTKPE